MHSTIKDGRTQTSIPSWSISTFQANSIELHATTCTLWRMFLSKQQKSAERDANDVQPTCNNCEVVRCRSSSFFFKIKRELIQGGGGDRTHLVCVIRLLGTPGSLGRTRVASIAGLDTEGSWGFLVETNLVLRGWTLGQLHTSPRDKGEN